MHHSLSVYQISTREKVIVKELLCARLPRTEGFKVKPYLDTVGAWTVGVGHNISVNGLPPRMVVALIERGCLTEDMVKELLVLDIDKVLIDCRAIPVFDKINVVRQSVIADMTFNMGLGKVLAFRKMFYCLDHGDFAGAAREMLDSKWADDVGARAKELANLMERGE
jgi:lysozyme